MKPETAVTWTLVIMYNSSNHQAALQSFSFTGSKALMASGPAESGFRMSWGTLSVTPTTHSYFGTKPTLCATPLSSFF